MNGSSILEILGLGAVGLAFLLAILVYRLVNKNKAKDNERLIKKFMMLVVVLCFLGATPQILQILYPKDEMAAEFRSKAEALDQAIKLNCDYRWKNCATSESTFSVNGAYTPMRPVESFLCQYCK